MKIRSELRLIERAIKQGWNVPIDEQHKSVDLILETLRIDNDCTKRERLAALRVLGALIENEGATDAAITKRANDALRRYEQPQTPVTSDRPRRRPR